MKQSLATKRYSLWFQQPIASLSRVEFMSCEIRLQAMIGDDPAALVEFAFFPENYEHGLYEMCCLYAHLEGIERYEK